MVTLIARPARAARLPVRWAALAAVVLLLLLTACGSSSGSGGEAERGVPARPESGAVLDEAGILDEDGMAQVNRVIADRNRESDAARVAVITVNRAPQDWERWTREVAGTWGVGDAGADNGVLLAIDMGERRTRLEVADGVRQRLDDDAAAAILDEVTEPALKDDEYVRGVRETVEAVYDQAEGRTPAAVAEGREGHRLGVIVATVILSLVGLALLGLLGGIWWEVRRWRRIADREIDRYLAEHPGQEVTPEVRRDYRKYRFHHRKVPSWQEEIDRRRERARREGREPESIDDPTEYTHYTPTFGSWLPLYMAAPSLYSGSGTTPPAAGGDGSTGAAGSTTSFGGGAGFTGGGASGRF